MSIYADTAISSSTFGWIDATLDSCGQSGAAGPIDLAGRRPRSL